MSDSEEALIKKIRDEVEKNGFLFELEVSKIFDKYGCHTRPNVIFKVDEKELEMDLIAYKTLGNFMKFNRLHVVCSCKKSKNNPWAFFLSPRKQEHHIYNLTRFSSNHGLNAMSKDKFRMDMKKVDINDFNINNFDSVSKTYLVPFAKSGSKHSKQIYESVKLLMDYMKYSLDGHPNTKTNQKIDTLWVPIIAVDTDLFGVSEELGEAIIERKNWIPLIVESDNNPLRESLLIYVVKKEYIEDFVKLLVEDHKNLDIRIKAATEGAQE